MVKEYAHRLFTPRMIDGGDSESLSGGGLGSSECLSDDFDLRYLRAGFHPFVEGDFIEGLGSRMEDDIDRKTFSGRYRIH